MRPGAPTSVLAGPCAVGVHCSVRRGDIVIAHEVPVVSCTLDVQTSRTVPGQVTMEVPLSWTPTHPLDPMNNFGQRILLTAIVQSADGRRWDTGLGEFLITSWQQQDRTLQVTAMDLTQTLEEDPMPWGSSPAVGMRLSQEVQRMAGALPVVVDRGVDDVIVSSTIQLPTSRTEAIRDLCTSYGCGSRMGSDGCLHIVPGPDGRVPVAHYSGRDLLVDAPRRSRERVPNRVYVTGTTRTGSGDDESETRWTGTAVADGDPYQPEYYGRVTLHKEMTSAGSQSAVTEAATLALRESLASRGTRSVEIAPDPRVEAGDVVAVYVSERDIVVGRVTAYSLPVDGHSETMRLDIEEVMW